MCRWLAYSGTPVLIEELLYKGQYSLIDQSLHSRMGAEATNGDGFGVGWYGVGDEAGRLPQHRAGLERPQPARYLGHVSSRLVFAHIRASTGTPGAADELPPVPPRPLALDAQRGHPPTSRTSSATSCSRSTPRSTRTSWARPTRRCSSSSRSRYGLEDDPPAAIARAIGLVEHVGREHGVEYPFQMTIATTDGERVWAFRYSSEGKLADALLHRATSSTLRELYPDIELLAASSATRAAGRLGAARRPPRRLERGTRVELGRHPAGPDELHPFEPVAPARRLVSG